MTKIEIICGTYGYRPDGSKHPIPIDRGGICEVSEEEAQRLFALCVARPAEETPSPAVATPPAGEDGSGAGADPSNSGEGAEGAESAHLDPEQLKTLTNAKLTELAKEMGLPPFGRSLCRQRQRSQKRQQKKIFQYSPFHKSFPNCKVLAVIPTTLS